MNNKLKFIFIMIMMFSIILTGCSKQLKIPAGQWVKVDESEHFVYYSYEDNEYDIQEVNSALKRLENFCEEIVIPAEDKIKYYKFRDKEQMKRLTGRSVTGKAFIGSNIVHSIYYSDAHEVAHIITTSHLEAPENTRVNISNFWLEGIAMYYTWPRYYYGEEAEIQSSIGVMEGESVHNHAKKRLEQNELPDVKQFIYRNQEFDDLNNVTSYTAAGSFVTYLLGRAQSDPEVIEKYLDFFAEVVKCNSESEVLTVFANVFNKDFDLVVEEWKEYLKDWDEESIL
ncbi:MAG: hypothetical protein ACOCQN_02790 [Halanaerobiaceae bacterium]